MKIGIDGSILSIDYQCGLKRYLENLIINLARVDSKNQYYIFSPKKIKIPQKSNFKLVPLPNWLPILKRQLAIPYYSHKYGIDVFHFPDVWGSIIPPCNKTVVTMQDLAPRIAYPLFSKGPKYFVGMILSSFIRKFTLAYASKIIVPTRSIKNEYENIFGKTDALTVINIGLSEEFRNTGVARLNDYILAFSDFSPRKNINSVIDAYNLLDSKVKRKISLKIIASTNYSRLNILDKVRELNLEKNVEIIVGAKTNKLVNLYNQATLLAYPSLYEGFGLPIIEAMACGCPVVTSNYGATREVAGSAAVLVNPHSLKSIYIGIDKLISNFSLRKEIVKKGIKRAQNFSWKNNAVSVLKLYTELTNT